MARGEETFVESNSSTLTADHPKKARFSLWFRFSRRLGISPWTRPSRNTASVTPHSAFATTPLTHHDALTSTTMDKNELETYQVQLSQVERALQADPDNKELSSLASELKELIDLTQATIDQAQAAASKSESTKKASQNAAGAAASGARVWVAGDECLAKYSTDGNWYPARITSVGGSVDNRVFSVVFRGYNTTELLKAGEIKSLPPSHQQQNGAGAGFGSASAKRKLSKEEEEDRERKKKKNEKKVETRAAKAKEQNEKQASWQKFAKKSEKKGIHIAGVSGTSIFKTPDNPLGKGRRRSDYILCFLVRH